MFDKPFSQLDLREHLVNLNNRAMAFIVGFNDAKTTKKKELTADSFRKMQEAVDVLQKEIETMEEYYK